MNKTLFENAVLGGFDFLICKLHKISEDIATIMGKQDDFNQKIDRANAALTTIGTEIAEIGTAVDAEREEVQAFIDAHPELDTSSLESVVSNLEDKATNLNSVSENVQGIFTAPGSGTPTTGTETGGSSESTPTGTGGDTGTAGTGGTTSPEGTGDSGETGIETGPDASLSEDE